MDESFEAHAQEQVEKLTQLVDDLIKHFYAERGLPISQAVNVLLAVATVSAYVDGCDRETFMKLTADIWDRCARLRKGMQQ